MLLVTLLSAALAGTAVNVATMNVDGQEVRDLTCNLESGGLLASMVVVGALSKHKAALDACAPQGAAFRVSWTWTGGATVGVTSVSASDADLASCVVGVLQQSLEAPVNGQCTATLLAGEATAAAAAADALSMPQQ